jgi:hypothetical protein
MKGWLRKSILFFEFTSRYTPAGGEGLRFNGKGTTETGKYSGPTDNQPAASALRDRPSPKLTVAILLALLTKIGHNRLG